MLAIALSILTASSFSLLFKLYAKWGLNTFQAIVVNYFTAAVVGMISIGQIPFGFSTFQQAWFPFAAFLGTFFFINFNQIAVSTARAGVSATTVAAKMSLVIPTFAAIWLYNEGLGLLKTTGILLALISVLFTVWQNKSTEHQKASVVLPLTIFFVAGILDTVFGYNQRYFLNEKNVEAFAITVFFCAFAAGAITSLVRLVMGTMVLDPKSLFGGVAIGIPNYYSVYFLVQALSLPNYGQSVIIPVINIGIVTFSAICALIIFKEKLSYINWLGIVLALLAIYLLGQ